MYKYSICNKYKKIINSNYKNKYFKSKKLMSLNINQNNFLQLNNPSVIMDPTQQFIHNQKNVQNIYMNIPKEKDTEKFPLEKINKEKEKPKQKITNIPKLPLKKNNSLNLPMTMSKNILIIGFNVIF